MSEHANTRVGDKSSLQQCVHLCVADGRVGLFGGFDKCVRGDSMPIFHSHCRGEGLYQPPENLRTLGGRKASCIW